MPIGPIDACGSAPVQGRRRTLGGMNFRRVSHWLHLPGAWLLGTFASHEAAAAGPPGEEPPRLEPPLREEEDEFEGEGWSFWPR